MSVSNLYPTGTTVENKENLEVVTAVAHSGFGSVSPATLVTRFEAGKGFNTCYIQLPSDTCTIDGASTITFTLANNSLFDIDPIVSIGQCIGYCRFKNNVTGVSQLVGVNLVATVGGIQARTDNIELTNLNAYTCGLVIQYPRA